MWQAGMLEIYLKQVEAQGGPKVYTEAIQDGRMEFVRSAKEGVDKLKKDSWGIFFEFEQPVIRELGNDPCLFVRVPNLGTPSSKLAFPFRKGCIMRAI